MGDSINRPDHYALNLPHGAEAKDVIKAVLGGKGFENYCRGNVIKYIIRADRKGGLEDLRKAAVYLGWEIDSRVERLDDVEHFLDGLGEVVKL